VSRALLVRHATCDPVGHRIAGTTPGIHLNDEGRNQAYALARRLADSEIAAVYTSPLERAFETAEPIAAAHDLVPVVMAEFTEFGYGDWTGRTFESLEGDPRWHDFNTLRGTTLAPGGELTVDVQARAVRALLQLAERHAGQRYVVVTHADVIRATVVHLLGMPTDLLLRFRIDPASITEFRFAGRWPELQYLNLT
jgi:broad specificity phosphatase PhoE